VAGAFVAPATPASAHGADAPETTAFRTTVTGIAPPMRGLSVRTVEAGARLELTNDSGRTVEVLGYAGGRAGMAVPVGGPAGDRRRCRHDFRRRLAASGTTTGRECQAAGLSFAA
jgi:hypothetical protein